MNKNFASPGEPVINNNASEALKSFIPDVFMSRLILGTVKVLLYYLRHEHDREDFLEDYLCDVERLLEFLDVLRDEYESSTFEGDEFIIRLQETIAQNQNQITQLLDEKNGLSEKYFDLSNRYSELLLGNKK